MSRICPECKSKIIDCLFSMNKLWCFNCRKFYDFSLKPGQKSILNKGIIGGNEDISSGSNEQHKKNK